jgi:hypothetical protein
VPCKCISDVVSDGGAALNLGSCPHPEFQYVLELFWQIIPPIVVAGRVRGKVVVDVVSAAGAMCDDVIGLPPFVLDFPATNVTATGGLSEDL